MTNFPGPPTWSANTAYLANQSEVDGGNGFYYVTSVSGVSGNTAPTWASVFGASVSDGTVTWITAQRSRQPWASVQRYTSGLPLTSGGSVTTGSPYIHSVPMAQFIPIGSYIIQNPANIPASQVLAVNVAASTITINHNEIAGGGVVTSPFQFNQYPYPWPDQIVTGGSGSPVVQCIKTGTSASVTPTWPVILGASVADGSTVWATVAFN